MPYMELYTHEVSVITYVCSIKIPYQLIVIIHFYLKSNNAHWGVNNAMFSRNPTLYIYLRTLSQ